MTELATDEDVAAALRRDLTDDESDQVAGLIAEAADLVAGYLHPCEIPDPVPGAVTRVVASMVAAVFNRPAWIPPDSQALSTGMYGATFAPGATSPGPYLTAAFKQRLEPFRCASGLVTVQLGSERRT